MASLDARRRCELTSFNSHKDLMGWIVTPSRRQPASRLGGRGRGRAAAGTGRGVIVLAGGASPPGRDDCTVQICKPGGAERRLACTSSPSSSSQRRL